MFDPNATMSIQGFALDRPKVDERVTIDEVLRLWKAHAPSEVMVNYHDVFKTQRPDRLTNEQATLMLQTFAPLTAEKLDARHCEWQTKEGSRHHLNLYLSRNETILQWARFVYITGF